MKPSKVRRRKNKDTTTIIADIPCPVPRKGEIIELLSVFLALFQEYVLFQSVFHVCLPMTTNVLAVFQPPWIF